MIRLSPVNSCDGNTLQPCNRVRKRIGNPLQAQLHQGCHADKISSSPRGPDGTGPGNPCQSGGRTTKIPADRETCSKALGPKQMEETCQCLHDNHPWREASIAEQMDPLAS
ncbi:Hypothetical predicted protein [Pelobates cultripes]|uniref:Uncharacterized protein n=1 Tax=Pelobates cultripes TaxID=61616 RepID=A0AAD1SFX2_PELCU|nr:Hypothetical predicted protein [Pelobates cultripes]